jgi:TBC1 domain family protein 5
MLNRGERWGFGQAMRDAVGEVRKNMQTLQSGRSSPLTRSFPGINVTQTHRSKRSDASSTIAANVLRRINALEERNKQLAKMLEAAVSDLWSFQKSLAEREKADSAESLEALNVAVAKVQFVQVYLSDSSLLLPEDQSQSIDRQQAGSGASTPGESGAEKSSTSRDEQDLDLEQHRQIAIAAPTVTVEMTDQNISDDSTQSDSIDNPQNTISATADSLPVTSALSKGIPTSKTSSSTSHRPTLVQSPFSYMLGQAHSDPSSSFLHATPFTPNERRSRGGVDKAFLFGDEEDVGSDDSRSKGASRIKGKVKGKGAIVREDIGLGELGNGGGTRIEHNHDD